MKTQLLPQDQVALFAYDRALPFTTDHQKVAEALERFKKSHEDVDFALGQQLGNTGMAPLYGKRVLPKKLQTKIDELVLGPGAAPAVPTPAEVIDHEAFGGMSLDQFMASSATALQDQGNLMALLEYLRRFDGQKHVLFVTENGLRWPSDESDRALAAIANDARASIHALETGGMLARGANEDAKTTVQQAARCGASGRSRSSPGVWPRLPRRGRTRSTGWTRSRGQATCSATRPRTRRGTAAIATSP